MRTNRFAALAVLPVLVGLGVPTTAEAATRAAQHYYVDCAAGNDAGAGSSTTTAWRTLARASTVTYAPGDTLSLRRGTTCHGVLAPKGSGTKASPIKINAYGTGALPAIVGDGARAAVVLRNVQGYQLQSLDVSDPGPADGSPRTGILVELNDYGVGSNYTITGVNVHDVNGCDCIGPDTEPSGGIVFRANGSITPTGFSGIEVTGNLVSLVDGYGIATSSQWNRQPLYPDGANTYVAMPGVHIAGNLLSNLGGDGVVVQNGSYPLIEYNRVTGYSKRAQVFHVGIYSWNSDHPTVQYNMVSGGFDSPLPSAAYGTEAGNTAVVMQDNISYGNGGFLYTCADNGMTTHGAKLRYNLSYGDRNVVFSGFTVPLIGNCFGDTTTGQEYSDNVVYAPQASLLVSTFSPAPSSYVNNVFSGAPGSVINDTDGAYDHNLYQNTTPPAAEQHAVIGDPLFTAPVTTGPAAAPGFRLRCGSPALAAGVPVAGNTRDLYGNSVPAVPSIGVYQGPCVNR
jgi:hypothetical protein